MYFYSPHQPQLLTTFSYNLHLALPNQWRTKKINFRSTDPPFMTYVRAEVASVFEWLRRSIRWMVRMNKNSVGPQQRVEMRVLPYGGGSLCFSLMWLDRISEGRRKLFVEVLTSFPLTKLFGKFRKIDEARLRSTSTHPSTVEGCVDVREERIGWIFLSFPNSNIKKKLDILGLSSFIYVVSVIIFSMERLVVCTVATTVPKLHWWSPMDHLAPEMEWWWWSGCYRWPCWSTVRGWWWSLCRFSMGWKKRQMPILNEFYMVIFTSKFIFGLNFCQFYLQWVIK